ncbi:ribonuclease H-like domain, reverse transcriptase, RNA-dependent DNA polymerase, partial [Tanacetum coccineum]
AHALFIYIQKQQRNNHKDQQYWVLIDDSWVQAMQEELLQFKLQQVYKAVKALCGLHQAPRAWYATLSTFLEKHGYRRGTIDKTLFIKKDKKDIMLVQVAEDSGVVHTVDAGNTNVPNNVKPATMVGDDNLGITSLVSNMMKDKSEVFKTLTQGKTSGEEDIIPTTLEAAKT